MGPDAKPSPASDDQQIQTTDLSRRTTMINLLRRRLSCSGVLATIALFLSLGGGAYALTLPRNSVGARHIKTGAVRSSDVKNASLRATDFKAGQLPAGPRGVQGPRGAKGDTGAPATRLWAIVDADGTLYRGSGVTSTDRAADGQYNVSFNQDVSRCAGVASTGGHALGNGTTGMSLGTAHAMPRGPGQPQSVAVMTTRTGAATEDRLFHLAVFC
jgi:hypothetical protein